MNQGIGPDATCTVVVEGQEIVCDEPKQTWVEPVSFCIDPLNHVRVARKWHIWMRTPKGVLDVMMTAHGRSYVLWMKNMLIYWNMANADGSFIFPDGRVVRSENMMCMLEDARTFMEP